MTWLAVVGALIAGAVATPVMADEAKAPVSASMLLNILAAPVESREAAYNQSIKEAGPAPRSAWVVQPDGSARYGDSPVSITVKNPCPPGTAHYEPPPLPGRRVRN
jgi:hypothetical protein